MDGKSKKNISTTNKGKLPKINSENQILEVYLPLQEKYKSFAKVIADIIGLLAKKNKRKYQLIHSRAKDPEKLKQKIVSRKRDKEKKEYKKLTDIEDLAGARVVFYLESDRKKFVEELYQEFGQKHVLEVLEKDEPNGYRATHMVIKLDENRTNLTEYSDFKDMKCEVQITSSLYHAWSEVEHDIIYKPDGDKEKLMKLGLDRLKDRFKEVSKNISGASIQLDFINEEYERIKAAGELVKSNFANKISSFDNDQIFVGLNTLEKIVDKEPDLTLGAILAVFSKKPVQPKVIGSVGKHEFFGKSHLDLQIKSLELLSPIRYHKPDQTLGFLKDWIKKDIYLQGNIKKVLSDFVKYDYGFIKQYKNYFPQQGAFKFIKNWDTKELIDNFDFVNIILKEILSSSVHGSEWTKEDTITFHSGSVVPTDFLKKLRRESLDILKKIFDNTKNRSIKHKVLLSIEESTRTPSSVSTPEVLTMINEDAEYVLKIYEDILFDSKNKLNAPISIVSEIESQLYWWTQWKIKEVEAKILRERILRDEFYKIYRLFVGDAPIDSHESLNPDYIFNRSQEIENILNQVSNLNIKEWGKIFNRIANEVSFVEEWKFQGFKIFLKNFAQKKPILADKLLEKAFNKSLPLRLFAEAILDGFRLAKKLKLWDKYRNIALKNQDAVLIRSLINNLYIQDLRLLKNEIRKEDQTFLDSIVKKSDSYKFLKLENSWQFHADLFRVLCRIFQVAPRLFEVLIEAEIKQYPELANHFIDSIHFAIYSKSFNLNKLSKQAKKILLEELVKVKSLEWGAQELLFELSIQDISLIFDVFVARMLHEQNLKKDRDIFDRANQYDAIPYNFNPKLVQHIQKSSILVSQAMNMLGKMTKTWSVYNFQVSHLFERIGGPAISSIVSEAIKKGGEQNLRNAAHFLGSSSGADIDLCMQIAAKTNDKKILSSLHTSIYSTGVVSGEYGIAEEYEHRAKLLEKYKESKNKRLRSFAQKTMEGLSVSARHARQSADEEKEKRRLRFEI